MSPSPDPSPETVAQASPEQISVTLRYFAAAAEAAGRPEERLDLPPGTTLAGLREQRALALPHADALIWEADGRP